jgi:hypothetical chaperone protein
MTKNTLAIDFGTSNSLVGALIDGQRIEALPLDPFAEDPSLMRTLLYFPNEDACFYGTEALQKFVENELEGRLFRSFKSHLPNQSYLGSIIGRRILSLENLIGIFLLELKKRSENFLGQSIERAVIGRPARYSMDDVGDGFALHRMKKAADFAGFKEVLFVPEPIAAALDYRRQLSEEKVILIGDFGGGTSDFTVLRVSNRAFAKEDVLGVDGCPLAGDALDSVFMASRLNRFFGAQTQYKIPMSQNLLTMPRSVMERLNKPAHIVHLKEKETYNFIKDVQKCAVRAEDKAAIDRLFVLIEDQQIFSFFEHIEKTKRQLSSTNTAAFEFRYPELNMSEVFSKFEFEEWSLKTKNEIFAALDRCLLQAQISQEKIDLVFLTGGTAHVPFVRQEFERRFGSEKLRANALFHSVLSGLVEAAKEWDTLY